MTKRLDVLVTCNEAYLMQARVMLCSLRVNNLHHDVVAHLIHDGIGVEELDGFRHALHAMDMELDAHEADPALFAGAPASERYPQAMYYRLLAPHMLPDLTGRVLYLDPDTLIINPLDELVDIDLEGNAFAAAAHTRATELVHQINRVRLGTSKRYLNSGVILMDAERARLAVNVDALFEAIKQFGDTLLLPDQDIFNALFWEQTLEVDDARWNYDVRNMNTYLLKSEGNATQDWVMGNTSILHYCGAVKPWDPLYPYRLGVLWKHYRAIANRIW